MVRIGMARVSVRRRARRVSRRRVTCVPDIWSVLTDEQCAKLELGNEAYRVLKRGETIERWYQVGVGCQQLQQAAMDYARTNSTSNRAYRDAWASLAEHVPDLRDIDKAARSHAIWMTENWEAVSRWLATQPVNVRLALNHPRSVHRKFDAAHKPPPPPDETKAPSTRVKLQDQIVQLTEQLAAQPPTRRANAWRIRSTGAARSGWGRHCLAIAHGRLPQRLITDTANTNWHAVSQTAINIHPPRLSASCLPKVAVQRSNSASDVWTAPLTSIRSLESSCCCDGLKPVRTSPCAWRIDYPHATAKVSALNELTATRNLQTSPTLSTTAADNSSAFSILMALGSSVLKPRRLIWMHFRKLILRRIRSVTGTITAPNVAKWSMTISSKRKRNRWRSCPLGIATVVPSASLTIARTRNSHSAPGLAE